MPSALPTDSPTEPPTHVYGLDVSPLTHCAHWNSPRDIIAIKHPCCARFYACISCHDACETHPSAVWPVAQRCEPAVLCGACKYVLTIDEYLASGNRCTACGGEFNPGCKRHWSLYFEMREGEIGA